MKPAGVTVKFGTKSEAKKIPSSYKPEDRAKRLEDENRSLRVKLKSIESQIAKNDAEATSKFNKLTEEINVLTQGSNKDLGAYETKIKESKEKVEGIHALRREVLEKLEAQNKENEMIKQQIKSLKGEANNLEETLDNIKIIAGKHSEIDSEIARLKDELKESKEKIASLATQSNMLISQNTFKKTAEELEEALRKKSEQESNLEKQLVRAKTTLTQLQEQAAKLAKEKDVSESESDEFYDAKDHPGESTTTLGEKHATASKTAEPSPEEIERIMKANQEWKDKCETMTRQLFEAKVAWAEENNLLTTNLDKMHKTSEVVQARWDQFKVDYANVKEEYDKLNLQRLKYAAKKKK